MPSSTRSSSAALGSSAARFLRPPPPNHDSLSLLWNLLPPKSAGAALAACLPRVMRSMSHSRWQSPRAQDRDFCFEGGGGKVAAESFPEWFASAVNNVGAELSWLPWLP